TKCNIEFEQSRTIVLWAIVFATPLFVFWGWLSDKIGRKWIMMLGMLLGILTYRPIFSTFLQDTQITSWQKQAVLSTATEIKRELTKNATDTIVTVSSKFKLDNGAVYTEKKSDSVFAN